MISKETQYRIYAGTRNDDYTGWEQLEQTTKKGTTVWSLNLGDGYFLDTLVKNAWTFFRRKKIHLNSLRRDRTISDPEGEYEDLNFSVLINVNILISEDAVKFETPNHSFAILSREPADWDEFSENVPTFEDDDIEQNWQSFYS